MSNYKISLKLLFSKNIIWPYLMVIFGILGIFIFYVRVVIYMDDLNKSSESMFDYNVGAAVVQMTQEIDKIELEKIFIKDNRSENLLHKVDSLNAIIDSFIIKYPNLKYKYEIYNTKTFEERQSLVENSLVKKDTPDKKTVEEKVFLEVLRYRDYILGQFGLVRNFVSKVRAYRYYYPTEYRINKPVFDSILRKKIEEKGIYSRIEFGVYSTSKNKWLYITDSNKIKEIEASSYSYEIFPYEIYSSGKDILRIYFPEKKHVFSSRIEQLYVYFIFLGLFIIASFVYTIRTIYKQDKLAIVKNDFVNNMTHELKTPVTNSLLIIDMLTDKSIKATPEQQFSYLEILRSENYRLQNLIDKILQSARLEKGQLALKIREIDIHELIEKVANNMGFLVMKNNGKINLELNAKNSILSIDEVHVSNVIYNLIDNSNKYTPVSPIITISTCNTDYGFEMSIEDNGVGISAEDQKKIFERFFRVHTGNVHNVKGFGLGLNYIKEIITRHGGKILVQSELKRGTKITVLFPKKLIKINKYEKI